ncbi:MAG TPA: YceI family protein [Lapillicoccus sp.]|nr:YceI family protein [Lapillicoccus sp.]
MALFNRTSSAVADQAAPASDIAGDYVLDPAHTRIGFSARHAMVTKVRGQFDEFEGTAHVDTENPAKSTVAVTIQTASVSTGQAQRDGHLKSGDFFDVETYPQITFASTDVQRDGTEWSITGDLTINAVTKPVTVLFEETGEAKDPFGNLRVGFEGAVTINRSDWDLKWNSPLETGGVLVSEKVTLEFDVSAIRQPA